MFNVYMNNRVSSAVNKLFQIDSDGYVFIYTPPSSLSTRSLPTRRAARARRQSRQGLSCGYGGPRPG